MGIKGLFKVLSDNAPSAVRITDWKTLSGRKVAIDASMSLYQFLIAVRQTDGLQLTSDSGEATSHLIGMFYRTIRIIENGLKPVYVFDGKPPELKGDELKKRLEAREKAEKSRDEIKETGTAEEIEKFERRTVTVSREQNEEAKRLLKLMGVPVVEAPGEAEATCAALAKNGKVWAAASEDMDTLTFGTPHLLRHLTAGDQKKQPIVEVTLSKALEQMELSYDQFVDLCILLGCDYCEPVRGMGPRTAWNLIKEHHSIEAIQASLSKKGGKLQIPETFPYKEVRKLFFTPDVINQDEHSLKWSSPDMEGLIDFLVRQKGFSEERVRAGAAKLSKGSSQAPQGRLTDFFKPAKRSAPEKAPTSVKKAKK